MNCWKAAYGFAPYRIDKIRKLEFVGAHFILPKRISIKRIHSDSADSQTLSSFLVPIHGRNIKRALAKAGLSFGWLHYATIFKGCEIDNFR